ncbi:MAG: tripartite tricarboxylate transporter substrate binding protein [Polaromonas sp.]|jgi:tripartite-type tricarboxylate transporter receptor subunit TctC|nr:tripartite tricarboxylate transporter substrate binding protein [Polaromonas sp.]
MASIENLLSGRSRRTLFVGVMALLVGYQVQAKDAYPVRPIKLIVPFAAGGTGDIVARLLSSKLAEGLGESVVIDNRGGGGSIIGTDAGAKAPADGYTLTLSNGAAITTGALVGQKLAYKPLEDFSHIFLIGSFPNMLVVREDHPAKDFRQFVELSRKDANGISWGSAGVGSAGFLAVELLRQLAKMNLLHVPYRGTGPAMTDLIGGSIGAMITSPGVAASQIKAGKLRALAVSSPARLSDFPDVPAMTEVVPGAGGDAWFGISVPANTPQPVIDRLHAELEKVIKIPQIRAQLQQAGLTPSGLGKQGFDKFLLAEISKWTPVIRSAKIVAD